MYTFTHLEQTQHGSRTFPAAYYYVDDRHPRYQMPFHWHNEWEILRVKSGIFRIFLDDGEFTAKAGDVVLIRGGILHGGMPDSCVYECFVFDLYGLFQTSEMVKKHLRPFYRQEAIPQSFFPFEPEREICKIADGLMSVFAGNTTCCELETAAYICRLFAWILNSGCYTTATVEVHGDNHRIDQLKAVLEHIETHYNSVLSLGELAGIVGMNPKYFCKFFSSLTHQTPMDYVNFYRIEHAAFLLDSTDLSVTAVGSECGFPESSYFTKVFKKYKGIAPKDYRHLRTHSSG